MSENKDDRIFKLTNFSPVGFKNYNYPVQFCSLCRGYLSDVCSNCIEKGEDDCDVVKQNESYYHKHCYSLINNKDEANKATIEIDSD